MPRATSVRIRYGVEGSHEVSQRLLVPVRCSGKLPSEMRSTHLADLASVIEPLQTYSYTSSEEQVVHHPAAVEGENSHRGMLESASMYCKRPVTDF